MENKINVLLLTSFKDKTIMYSVVSPPLGLLRLQHYLTTRNISCDLLDFGLTDGQLGEYLNLIESGYYDIIGFGVAQENMGLDLGLIWDLRKRVSNSRKRCLFIAGGQAATHNYKQWITEGELDAILLGFAEKPLYELCMKFSEFPNNHISQIAGNIDGIVYCGIDGNFVNRPSRQLAESEFTELNYDECMDMHIPYEKYWEYTAKEGSVEKLNMDTQKFFIETVRLYTSSHCSWKCGFCNSHSFLKASQGKHSRIYRLKPTLIHQLILDHIEKYKPKVFLFNDDSLFDGSKEGVTHILELCQLIIESKKKGSIEPDVIFNCQAKVADFLIKEPKVRRVNSDLIDVLVEAGFYHFGIGVESFSDRLLRSPSINKKAFTEKDAHMVISALLEAGLSPSINIILFVPEATVDEIVYTMKALTNYILKGCQVAMTPLMRPNPGSPIYYQNDIDIVNAKWVNPHNNRIVFYPSYCVPNDKKIAEVVNKFRIREFKDMAKIADIEQDKIIKSLSWNPSVVPRTITALSVFLAVSKLLDRYDMVKFFKETVCEILTRNSFQLKQESIN